MQFLSPLFLVGLAAIAIPLALHLFRKRADPIVPFGAVRLLRQAPVEQARRRRLRDLLLLALRVAALVLLAIAALVFFYRRGIAFPEGLEGSVLLTLMPLLSPQGWDYVFLIATPAIVYIINYVDLLPRPIRFLTVAAVVTIGFSLFDLMGRTLYYAFMRLSFISLCFFVVIAALATLRLRKIA